MTIEGQPVGRRYFRALDAFRGLCALFVAGGHLRTGGLISQFPLFNGIGRWVDFFFVLSGFVIAHTAFENLATDRRRAAAFLIRRIGRIWPLHMVMLVAVFGYQVALYAANQRGLVADPVAFTERNSLLWLPLNVAMVQSWGFLPWPSWNSPAWSISAEFAAYLLFALCMALAGRRGRWLLFVVGGLSGLLMMATTPDGMRSDDVLSVPRCLFGFSAGVLVHQLWKRRAGAAIPKAWLVEPAVLCLAFYLITFLPRDHSFLVVPIFGLTVFVFANEDGWLSRALTGRVGHFLGERSYSIYMTHFLLATCILSAAAVAPKLGLNSVGTGKIGAMTGIVGPELLTDAIMLLYLAGVILLGSLTLRWIENPARLLAGRLAQRVDVRWRSNNGLR